MKNFKYLYIILFFVLSSCGNEDKKLPAESNILQDGYIKFSNFNWVIDSSANFADSPNLYLINKNNVEIDKSGNLVVSMKKIGDTWFGGKITSDSILGYGDYIFYIESKIDKIDANVNFSIIGVNVKSGDFEGLTQMGIAFSYYGDKSLSSDLNYFKYSTDQKVAESIIPDHPFKLRGQYSVHKLRILQDEIGFYSYDGENADESKLINKYEVKRENTTKEFRDINYAKTSDSIKVVIYLCLNEANKPDNDKEINIVIKKFEFKPVIGNLSKK
jgi:hypothetical protein